MRDAEEQDSRGRILAAALALMSEHGVAGTSMRMLAGECGLNVATLYHYFPSKAELLQSVLTERAYLDRLATQAPPAEVTDGRAPAVRLRRLIRWLWWASQEEEAVWRLLVGESLRGDPTARAEALALVDGLDLAVAGWVDDAVPELAARSAVVARLIRGLLFSLIVEHLALGPDDDRARSRIDDLVAVVAP